MREGNKLLLEAENLCVSYRTGKKDLKAVDRVSFGIERGDTLGIIGESGSGKSTIVMAMLRQLDPRFASISGSVKFDGQDLLSMPEDAFKKLLWRRIAIVFQKSMNSLSPVHRIGSQFEDIYRVHEPHASKAQIRQRALELFNLVNLPERVYTLYPHELSGGMMQRLSIVLSLMFNPDLLIMDEATTALDVVTQGQILREIMKLEQGMNLTRVMITHDLSVVTSSCGKIMVLYAGQMMEFGTVDQVVRTCLHPYTEGLIRSFPSLYGEKRALRGIPGTLPDLTNPPQGCVFAPRCPYASDRCLSERPNIAEYAPGHFAACHRCAAREAK